MKNEKNNTAKNLFRKLITNNDNNEKSDRLFTEINLDIIKKNKPDYKNMDRVDLLLSKMGSE